ncbi:MAG: DUF3575 domain-containing protein [Duncaniella sp.]|nr:DUF3575 domain-containing protein [Duncaniella sp.]
MTTFAVFGSPSTDSVNVSFRVGHRQFDPSLGDNREAMDNFIQLVQKADAEDNIDSIVIRAYASPDGTDRANVLLSQRRCDAIAELIASRTGINRGLIHKMPEGVAWSELRRLVAETPDVPSRQKALDVLDNTPVWVFDAQGKIIDGRKKQLMDLDGGRVYRWLYVNLFPQVRNAVAVALIRKQADGGDSAEVPAVSVSEPVVDETAVVTETVDGTETEVPAEEIVYVDETDVTGMTDKTSYERTDSRFALKTNLLDYAILMPNLEVEWKFADRWSAALEGQGAWYSKTPPHKVYRVATLLAEVRFWVINRSLWHGMYVGAFGGPGLYDLCDGKKGHEGEGGMAGISVGYMWPIGKHLSLDAGIGVGYLHVRDKEYKPIDGHYLYQLTKDMNYVGPLRAKLSLVWRIPSKKYQTVK